MMGKLNYFYCHFPQLCQILPEGSNPIKSHETTIFLWFSHGFWFFYSFPMVFLCFFLGVSHDFSYVFFYGFPVFSYVVPMVFQCFVLWFSCVFPMFFPMVFLCFSYVFFFPWCSFAFFYGFPMMSYVFFHGVSLLFVYGFPVFFPMVFLWFSCAFPMVFL